PKLQILVLTRFLHANRYPPRIKSGAGFCSKTLWPKKAGDEAGGPRRPFPFRRRGAYSIERYLEGASFGPAPRKEPSAGATDAGETLHLVFNPWPAALPRTATNRRSSRA